MGTGLEKAGGGNTEVTTKLGNATPFWTEDNTQLNEGRDELSRCNGAFVLGESGELMGRVKVREMKWDNSRVTNLISRG